MLFSLICIDKPNSGDLRAATREAHIAYLKSVGAKIVFAGAMTNPEGDAVVGSKFLLEIADQAEAEGFAAADPYTQAELFQSSDVRPVRRAIWHPESVTD
jgi:uncharacterized protein YciI